MVNETVYRYLWTMDKEAEQAIADALAKIRDRRLAAKAQLEALSEESTEAAIAALKEGARPSVVAKGIGYTDGYVRKLRKDAKLPPDPRYAGVTPPKRHLGFGEVGIGDTPEEAIANSGPIDYGEDLRALVVATPRQRIVDLVERLRREDADWYRSMQDVVNTASGDVAVEILVYALAENRLTKVDFAS